MNRRTSTSHMEARRLALVRDGEVEGQIENIQKFDPLTQPRPQSRLMDRPENANKCQHHAIELEAVE